jgi:hypothetical protein
LTTNFKIRKKTKTKKHREKKKQRRMMMANLKTDHADVAVIIASQDNMSIGFDTSDSCTNVHGRNFPTTHLEHFYSSVGRARDQLATMVCESHSIHGLAAMVNEDKTRFVRKYLMNKPRQLNTKLVFLLQKREKKRKAN